MTTAIILAGGLGTRLRAVVPDAPKPMALINGRPFLEHQMDYWIKQGVSHFILSIGYRAQDIKLHFKDQYRNIPISYAVEENPLGTGGGLLLALEELPDEQPFLVLNGDTFVECSLTEILNDHTRWKAGWTMVAFRADKPERYGAIEMDEDGRILQLLAAKAGLGDWANAGVYMISPAVLADFAFKAGEKISLEQDLLASLIAKKKRCFTSVFKGVFIDIGLPDDYVRAAKLPAFN